MGEVMDDVLTTASILAGLWAAWLWWCSTRVRPFNPQWGGGGSPVATEASWREETALFMQATVRARELAGRAALWAMLAIALHGVAALLWHVALLG